MASKTNLPSLIDMVLEYKLGRTNQVADALSRKTPLVAATASHLNATSGVTSTLPHRIRDGLLVTKQKGIYFFFFQNLSFFGMPLREQGVPRTSGAKTKQGEFFVGGNPLIAY
jgi:hypothetical protein